jgi:membrane protease YdiL (CAAX protease family)
MFTVPAGLDARGTIPLPIPSLLLVALGGFGPLLAAVLMAALNNGRAGIRALVTQLNPRDVQRRWFAIPGVLVILNLVPVAGYLLAGGTPPTVDTLHGVLVVFSVQLVLVAAVGGGLGEEMGWRGYALPRWLQISSPLVANVLLGIVWSLWHLPLWLDPSSSQAAYPFAVYLVTTVGQSIVIGWMYCASGGSLLVAILAHAVANATDGMRYQILGGDKGDLGHQVTLMATMALAASVVTVLTRGRLGADRLPPDAAPLIPTDSRHQSRSLTRSTS